MSCYQEIQCHIDSWSFSYCLETFINVPFFLLWSEILDDMPYCKYFFIYCAEHSVVISILILISFSFKRSFHVHFSSLFFLYSLFLELPLIRYGNFHIDCNCLISFLFSISLFLSCIFKSTFRCILSLLSSGPYIKLFFFFCLRFLFPRGLSFSVTFLWL